MSSLNQLRRAHKRNTQHSALRLTRQGTPQLSSPAQGTPPWLPPLAARSASLLTRAPVPQLQQAVADRPSPRRTQSQQEMPQRVRSNATATRGVPGPWPPPALPPASRPAAAKLNASPERRRTAEKPRSAVPDPARPSSSRTLAPLRAARRLESG